MLVKSGHGLVDIRGTREFTPILGCTPCYTGGLELFIPTDALIVYNRF